MNAFDRRTRIDGAERFSSAAEFFGVELSRLAAEQPEITASVTTLDLRPIVVDVDGDAWVCRFDDGSFHTAPASTDDRPKLQLRLREQDWFDLYNDHTTPIGLMTGGRLDLVGSGIGRFLDWWLVWRGLLDGRPIHHPGAIDPSTDLPADLQRSFTLDDPIDDIMAFLDAAGYVHLRGVFEEDEMAAISADMDAAHHGYRPGDGNSWWATLADGTDTLVRMQRFDEVSAAATALLSSDRFLRLGAMTGAGHVPLGSDVSRIEALYKPIGVTKGISDVPWHRDCSLGRHSYLCPSLTIGVSVSPGGPESGQLRVIAGSHRAHSWPSLVDVATLGQPDIALPTQTGDVTIHQSCTLHMAQPPTTTERRVLYTDFRLPQRGSDEARAANAERLRANREGAPQNTSQVAAPPQK